MNQREKNRDGQDCDKTTMNTQSNRRNFILGLGATFAAAMTGCNPSTKKEEAPLPSSENSLPSTTPSYRDPMEREYGTSAEWVRRYTYLAAQSENLQAERKELLMIPNDSMRHEHDNKVLYFNKSTLAYNAEVFQRCFDWESHPETPKDYPYQPLRFIDMINR